nr:hypothetical protein [Tanacetum cinerariifolium]
FLLPSEYDSFLSEDFSEVDALPSTNKKDKVFNPGILIQENLFEVITRVAPEKKLAISHASLILEDFDPPLYELPCFKEVSRAETLLSFSSKKERKNFKPSILTSKEVHSSLIPELSHQDSKEDKIKESKLFIDELDPPRSSDFLPSPECDSVLYEDFSEVDVLPSTNNEEKVFNLEVLRSETLLSFSSKNEKKVFNLGILTSKGVHTSLLPELSHRGPKAFKSIKNFESPMEIFPCSYGEEIRILDVLIAWILKTRARGFVPRSLDLHILSFILGIQYPNPID